jgi:hypothetical protein
MSEYLCEDDSADSPVDGRRLSAILISPKFRMVGYRTSYDPVNAIHRFQPAHVVALETMTALISRRSLICDLLVKFLPNLPKEAQ